MLKKVAVFADVQNIYYTTRHAYQRQFNYREAWKRIAKEGEIVIANAYAIHRADSRQLGFQKALRDIGFTIKLKPFIRRSDGSAKGDWDVGITIDIMEAATTAHIIVLLSGDGDFDMLLEKVRKDYGVKTIAYGVPALTANSLIEAADEYYPIEENLLM